MVAPWTLIQRIIIIPVRVKVDVVKMQFTSYRYKSLYFYVKDVQSWCAWINE